MTDLMPLSGVIVPAAPRSVREVDPRWWDQDAAWDAAVEFWLESKKSLHSRAAYRRDITLWRRWCEGRGTALDDARRNDADAWRDRLAATESHATVARRLSAVSSFYAYWMTEDAVARNPAANAARPKVSLKPGSIALTQADCSALLAYVNSLADLRPGIIFRLLAETGMRVGEMTAAKVADLMITGGHHALAITGKGDQPDLVAIFPATAERIRIYLAGRKEGYLLHVEPTNRRTGDGQMDRSYVRRLLRRIAREAGIEEAIWMRMHPHVLRHSAATLLAADGAKPHEIQQQLRHADLRTTQRYIHHAEGLDNNLTYRMAAIISK